ncbi:DUF983 domain-containing protein [Sphingomonas nostoxanthinifaciens]|uniref:DUF983 domain-containing protein n=1 Tax=Sphingomonas nostoxanthinifaciens TaxID=2872652 RepID=UPI001CC208E2|nr:DUF983 domain-containing protein [Sphingomonas nostoxanthinifaciens]UAK25321.1 DUF983 domain-containing protein [Sphingomonas nostoxanthinifaciens]
MSGEYKIAMLRGLRRHCPTCDSPTLFAGYLKVRPICPVCGADNGQYRVDDAASYFTVLLVGHLIVGPLIAFPALMALPLWLALLILLPLVAAVTLAALPYIKGTILGVLAAGAANRKAAP